MNRYLPIWGRVTLLCITGAILLGLVYAGVSFPLEKREAEILEGLAQGWRKDTKLGEDLIVGINRPVHGLRYVKSYTPLRTDDGQPELYLVYLYPGKYFGNNRMQALYTRDGKLVGHFLERSAVPIEDILSKSRTPILQILTEGGMWTYRPQGTVTLGKEELEVISGSTFSFLVLTEVFQEGAEFVRSKGNN